jgi:hypothetical protein
MPLFFLSSTMLQVSYSPSDESLALYCTLNLEEKNCKT